MIINDLKKIFELAKPPTHKKYWDENYHGDILERESIKMFSKNIFACKLRA